MKKNILIVDDEKLIVKMISLILEQAGYRTTGVNDGESALELIPSDKPDLILLDLMMPGLDGFQVLERLKSNYDTRDIPVIIVSALEEKENIDRVKMMGASDYIVKGSGPKKLVDIVNELFADSK